MGSRENTQTCTLYIMASSGRASQMNVSENDESMSLHLYSEQSICHSNGCRRQDNSAWGGMFMKQDDEIYKRKGSLSLGRCSRAGGLPLTLPLESTNLGDGHKIIMVGKHHNKSDDNRDTNAIL